MATILTSGRGSPVRRTTAGKDAHTFRYGAFVCDMTAAPESLRPFPAHAFAPARPRLSKRWERALIVVGICLPVPVFAATGLSMPLPSSVERIAVALVPWSDSATLDENQALPAGASGSIVRAPGEKSVRGRAAAVTPSAATNPRPANLPTASVGSTGHGHGSSTSAGGGSRGGGSESPSGSGGGSSGGVGGAGGSGTTSPGGDTGPGTDPVSATVNQVKETTQPTVDQVDDTVTGVVDTAGDTVDGVASSLGK
ncbi:MAG TPA: hypothetical protein VE693_12005 [Gaiellaceae bacterium]|nr:hypothetical protein [Gaiellaceae bacterium]